MDACSASTEREACRCHFATSSRELQSRICMVAVHQPEFALRVCTIDAIEKIVLTITV